MCGTQKTKDAPFEAHFAAGPGAGTAIKHQGLAEISGSVRSHAPVSVGGKPFHSLPGAGAAQVGRQAQRSGCRGQGWH